MRKNSKIGNRKPADSGRNIGMLIILIAAVCVVVLAVHWPALSAKVLSFDDSQYFTDNVLVQNPGWTSAKRFLTEVLAPSTVKGYYQPLAMISLMFDYSLGGRENNLMPFHRTSLILHIANTALIIALLYLLFGQTFDRLRVVSKPVLSGVERVEPIWIAAGVGLLFGVHPVTVEPIPWIGERKTLLAAFFALWSLFFYVRYAQKSRRGFYLVSFAMYFLALMSKPTSVPIPVVMLLMDYWPLRRFNRQSVLEKLPFFVLGSVAAVVTYISQSRTAGAALPGEGRYSFQYIPLTICYDIVFYLCKILWPANLSSHYIFPRPFGLSNPVILAGVIGTCVLIFLLLLSLRWTKGAMTGFSVFFVAIFPTMQTLRFSDVIASDKFAYLPSVGLLMILASFLGWLCGAGITARALVRCRTAAMVVLILACAETVATRRYLVYWQDSASFFEYMLTLTPNEPSLLNNLGNAFKLQRRFEKAVVCYKQGLQIKPDDAGLHYNLAVTLQSQGKLDEAINHYRKSLRADPQEAATHNNLGVILLSQGKLDEAADCFRQTLRLNPDRPSALSNLAWILAAHPDPKIRDPNQAVAFAERAAKLTHYEDIFILNTLMLTYTAVDRLGDAVNVAQKSLVLASAAGDREQAEQIRRQIKTLKEQKEKKK